MVHDRYAEPRKLSDLLVWHFSCPNARHENQSFAQQKWFGVAQRRKESAEGIFFSSKRKRRSRCPVARLIAGYYDIVI